MAQYKYHKHGWKKHDEEVKRRTVAELEKNGVVPNPNSSIYKKTFNRFSAVYRSEVAAERKAKKKLEAEWVSQHKTDTDEALLTYLRAAITEPKLMLGPNRITGGHYIVERFGGWRKALAAAGLIDAEEADEAPAEPALPKEPPQEQTSNLN